MITEAQQRKTKPRHRRMDLINDMPTGEQKRIAKRLNCSKSIVSKVLNGHSSQVNDLGINIIRLAEHAAEKARLKRRF